MSQAVFKIFIVFYEILWLMEVFIRLYFDQINFSPHNCHTSYFFNLHFNIIPLVQIYSHCSAFSQIHNWKNFIFLLWKNKHSNLRFLTCMIQK